MIETDIIQSPNITNRLFVVLRSVLEFIVVFFRFTLELFTAIVNACIGTELKDLSGEVILITGTGHGIGRELALQYTNLGCTVICVDINEKGNQETVNAANCLGQGTARCYTCDVSKRDNVLDLARKIKIEVGRVSVLVNNVGIMPTHPLDKQSTEEIHKVFDINVMSQFWTLEAFLPHMKEQNRGHIVCISSIAGLVGLSNLVPYCATKYAVRGMMEALSEELRDGPYKNLIRTTTIFPYMTNTGLCKKPKVKFPSILGLLDPKQVASYIVEAHRKNVVEATIPWGLLPFTNFCRMIPISCALTLKDYIDSGVESDL